MNDNEKRDFCTGCGLLPQRPVKPKAPVCGCKKKKCCKKNCCDTEFAFRKVVIPAALGDDVTGKAKPENGAYTNSYVEYEAGGAQYMYDSYGVYTKIEPGSEGTLDFNELENRPRYAGIEMTGETNIPDFSDSITALQGSISDEQEARISADSGLQTQIDALSAASDVTDIVGTYAELEAYDTSKLKDNDIIKVLQDETHDDETTYYRWVKATSSFTLIGEEGPYYTKAAADQKFQDKLTAGDGVTIDSNNVISADGETIFYANLSETGSTRHIYKDIDFTSAASAQDIIDANDKGQVILRGTSLVNPTAYSDSYLQNAFIMPHNSDYEFVFLDRDLRHEYTASATTDTAFYYDASEIQPKLIAGTNVQITGTTISATDTTYSNFTGTDGVDPGTAGLVPAPATTDAGKYLKADGTWDSIVIPQSGIPTTATFWGQSYDSVNNRVSGALKFSGAGASGDSILEIYDSTGQTKRASLVPFTDGSIRYDRGGVAFSAISADGISLAGRGRIQQMLNPTAAQDAATKNYTDNLVISYAALNGSAAPTTATEGKYVGQLYYDTTNDDMYYCSAITAQGTTPETYAYTWNTIGGGPTVVQTTGTSQTDVMSQAAASQLIYPSGYEASKTKIAVGADATTNANQAIAIGYRASASGGNNVAIGTSAGGTGGQSSNNVYIGAFAESTNASNSSSVALGSKSRFSRSKEVSVGSGQNDGYTTRYIANVTDPSLATDAANKRYVDAQIVGTSETLTIATTDWTALSASSPYDYSATVTATTTISATSTVELINDQAVLFGTYGFAIGSVDTVNNTVAIYSIGQPSASVSLTIKVRS